MAAEAAECAEAVESVESTARRNAERIKRAESLGLEEHWGWGHKNPEAASTEVIHSESIGNKDGGPGANEAATIYHNDAIAEPSTSLASHSGEQYQSECCTDDFLHGSNSF